MKRIDKIENLINAVGSLHDYSNPQSEAYILKNPLMLRSYSKPGKHDVNESGVRQFESFQGGFRSAVWDISLKVSGKSNSGLKTTDTLKNLLAVLGISKEQDQLVIVFFLRKCVHKDIDLTTTLAYFDKD